MDAETVMKCCEEFETTMAKAVIDHEESLTIFTREVAAMLAHSLAASLVDSKDQLGPVSRAIETKVEQVLLWAANTPPEEMAAYRGHASTEKAPVLQLDEFMFAMTPSLASLRPDEVAAFARRGIVHHGTHFVVNLKRGDGYEAASEETKRVVDRLLDVLDDETGRLTRSAN